MAKDFKIKGYTIKEMVKNSNLYAKYAERSDQKFYHAYGNKVNMVGTRNFIERTILKHENNI